MVVFRRKQKIGYNCSAAMHQKFTFVNRGKSQFQIPTFKNIPKMVYKISQKWCTTNVKYYIMKTDVIFVMILACALPTSDF